MTARRTLAAAALLAFARVAHAEAFFPGEESVFQLRYLDIPTGEARIQIGTPAGSIWPVIFQARSGGLAGIVDVREHLVSYWDSDQRDSRGYDLRAYEIGDYHEDRGRFDRPNGKATLERTRKGGDRSTTTFDVSQATLDITSAFMWLREQDLAPGARREVPVWCGSEPFVLVAQVLGREEVDTPAGRFRAVKVQVQIDSGKFSTKRDSFVWFSDDPRHVIVKVALDLALGRIAATLRSYRPGTQIASR